jgi:ribosomal protein L37AE/L43A
MNGVSVCGGTLFEGRARLSCPTCERETDFLRSFGGVWYGDLLTCTECGDAWSDGYRCHRPFERAWRQKRTAQAREAWERALSEEEYRAAVSAELDAELAASAPCARGD